MTTAKELAERLERRAHLIGIYVRGGSEFFTADLDEAAAMLIKMDKALEPDHRSLDERMKDAGMIPLSAMLENTPFTKYQIHAGMNSLEAFEGWLKQKHEQFATMRMDYELNDKDKDDDLYEWVFAHSAVFSDVLMQFRAARAARQGGE